MSSSRAAGGAARPRGPWRSAWFRLRRDRWSLAALIFLCVLLLSGLVGGAVVTRLVGHNGVDPFPYATNADLRPTGPWTHVPVTKAVLVDDFGRLIPPRTREDDAVRPRRRRAARPGRVDPHARRRPHLAGDRARRSVDRTVDRAADRHRSRLLRRSHGRCRLVVHRDGDGLPAAPVPDLRERADQLVAPVRELRLDRPGGGVHGGAPDRPLHVVLSNASRSARTCRRFAEPSSSRRVT